MSSPGRRDVLRFGLTAAGALLVEVALPGCAPSLPRSPRAHARDFAPNAWLRIAPDDRIFFVLDRVEMGQGTMTSHAQLVAEELEVNPARLIVELAPADRAYDNPDSDLGFQVTGGSTSVRTSFDPLRSAGATARELLRKAAARLWQVEVGSCAASDGTILHPASGRHATYGQLAAGAARETVGRPRLKSPKDFRWIGTSLPRLDAPDKVDGRAVYGIDVRLPDLLCCVGVVLRAPVLGAKVQSFDATRALGDKGVVDVVQVSTGVAVVATSYWRARRAADKVRVAWSEGLTMLDTPSLRESFRNRVMREGHRVRKDGEGVSAERHATSVLEAFYELPYLAHATLEPQNATAVVGGGRCEVWAPTQSPGLAREALRRLTGYPYEDIVVHQTLLGGGYGRRLVQDYIVEAAEVALRVRRPVKVIWSREEDTRTDFYRPMVAGVMRAGLSADGAITSWFHRVTSQSIVAQIAEEWAGSLVPSRLPLMFKRAVGRTVASAIGGNALPDLAAVEGAREIAYAIPNVEIQYAPIRVDVPVGWWRSVGPSHNVFMVEAFLDEVARAARRDPLELRRSLLAAAPRNLRVLELAAAKIGWGSAPPAGVHRGIAQATAFRTYSALTAEVSVEGADVRVHRVVAAVDCGRVVNPDLVRAQVEGGIGFGLGAALKQEITLSRGRVEQSNFHDFESLRMHEMPEVEVHIVESDEPPTGIGEPSVPLIAPALANAILAATGHPVRTLPIRRALARPS